MPTLWDFYAMSIEEKRKWETSHSSLIRQRTATYEQCRAYSCQSITNDLTRVSVKKGNIVEIPHGIPFNFIGRVDTSMSGNNPQWYYQAYIDRQFISYTTICNKNVSHYEGDIFFLYNLYPEDIVHIFPMDSDTQTKVSAEKELTPLPSLWITLSELNMLSKKWGVYNQVTAKTKRNGQIIKPFAVAAFEETNDNIQEIADLFEVGTVILHPDRDAINYNGDLLYDYVKLKSISEEIQKLYGFSVTSLYYAY